MYHVNRIRETCLEQRWGELALGAGESPPTHSFWAAHFKRERNNVFGDDRHDDEETKNYIM